MVRSTVKKVMWMGRATVFLVGLAVILALMFGVASRALAGTGVGGVFNLGVTNTVNAITTLVSGGAGVGPAGPMLRIDNNSTNSAATALELLVEPGKAPMKVNSTAGKATNLNADKVDGREASSFANVAHAHAGEQINSGTVAEPRIDGAIARDAEVMNTVRASDGPGSGLDADRLDNYDSSSFGIETYQMAHHVSSCDTPSTWNECAKVTIGGLDPSKEYVATVWSSFSAKAPLFSSREVSYCPGMSGLSSSTPCVTVNGQPNKVRVHDYFTAASASAVKHFLTGASSYTFFTAINPSGEFEFANDGGDQVITTVMLRRSDTPSP
jgi:hypothetical protein